MAYYDSKPSILEAVGNGSYLYRWDIDKTTMSDDDNNRVAYSCNEVTVWAPLSANKITEAVITSLWDANYEQKVINDYNMAQLGLCDEQNAKKYVDAYKNFLATRKKIKEQVDSDCNVLNIR